MNYVFNIAIIFLLILFYLYLCWWLPATQFRLNKFDRLNLFTSLIAHALMWGVAVIFVLGFPGLLFLTTQNILKFNSEMLSLLVLSTMFFGLVVYCFGIKKYQD